MPELPEVETVIRYLNKSIKGQKVTDILVPYEKILKNFGSVKEFKNLFIGHQILKVQRRAKYLIFKFDHINIVNHLRMEGKWYFEPSEEPFDEKHTLLRIKLEDGNELRYNDTRRFGTFDIRSDDQLFNTLPLKKLGLEPFDDKFNADYLIECAKNKNIAIKTFLLDQSYVVGIGNIYACEICFDSKIHPEKVSKYVSKDEMDKIVISTRQIMKEAIEKGGTTVSSFHPAKNVDGNYFNNLKVYGRAGKECFVCKNLIKKIKLNQRGTYYCGQCQNF